MNTLARINRVTSPHLVGGDLPFPLVEHLARTDSHFLGNYTQFLALHGAAPNVSRHTPFWGAWTHHYRHPPGYTTLFRTPALLYQNKWQEDVWCRTRWNHIHDFAAYGRLEGHTCLPRWDEAPSLVRLSEEILLHVVTVLRQAYNGKRGMRLLPAHKAACERGLKGWKWEMPLGRSAANALRKELKAKPPTPENVWLWEWAPAYRFRALHGPIFLNAWHALPPEVQAFVIRYVGRNRKAELAKLLPYQQVALAQCMLAPPSEIFPKGFPDDWMHEHALGHATRRMPELCTLPLEHTPQARKA